MANVKKWVVKSKNNALDGGEEILSALGVSVNGKVRYMAEGLLVGGTPGMIFAGNKLKTEEAEQRAQGKPSVSKYPRGAVILALTQTRLLVYRLNFLGRPKMLGTSYSRHELAQASMEKRKMNYLLTISFNDGGEVMHDVDLAQGGELERFITLINLHQTK